MESNEKCNVCKVATKRKCGKCWNVFYCSREHQAIAWKKHQKICRPFKVCSNEQFGRYVIATKPIKEGDVVLQERPLVEGPGNEQCIVCMGCLKGIKRGNMFFCPKCRWSLCNEECGKNSNHAPECHYISKERLLMSEDEIAVILRFILPLRCLYQKKFYPHIWDKLSNLECHKEKLKSAKRINATVDDTFKVLYGVFRVNDDFSDDDIETVCGIININSFEVSSTAPAHAALFEIASYFEHNCKANCRRVFNSKGLVRIVAVSPIKEGEHLSVSYMNSFLPTFERQEYLRETKFFTCQCERCLDVTEFGTNFSALKCQNRMCQGLLLPASFIIEGLDWACNKCQYKKTSTAVLNEMKSLKEVLNDRLNYSQCKAFLEDQAVLLPENHAYMVKARDMLLAAAARLVEENAKQLSDNDLEVTLKAVRQLVTFLHSFVPAESKFKGEILSLTQCLVQEIYFRKKSVGEVQECFCRLREIMSLMRHISVISRYEMFSKKTYTKFVEQMDEVDNLIIMLKNACCLGYAYV